MKDNIYNSLELREIFHLEFLRWLTRKIKVRYFAIKGGTNLRLFFKSFRYSEDVDLDAQGLGLTKIKDAVMGILENQAFQNSLNPFGIESIVLPDMSKAKQTQTTQRFKTHLINYKGEDLFTKIEFSRRGFRGNVIIEDVADFVLRAYKLAPLVVPHYDINSCLAQKIEALASRAVIQARDVFDIYVLSTQYAPRESKKIEVDNTKLTRAYENIFEISFGQFRDTVISYLSLEEQAVYASASVWDEIKLKVTGFLEELKAKLG